MNDMPNFTPEQVRDIIRNEAIKLAKGEIEQAFLNHAQLRMVCDDVDFINRLTPQYVRVLMSRVPEVAERGRVAIRKGFDENGCDALVITFKAGSKPKRVFTDKDVPNLQASWRRKFIKHLLKTSPNISDLSGEKLEGAAEGISRFCAMLEGMIDEQD